MVKIRLARVGAKNQAKYRIVAADEKFKRDGRFIEILGYFDPTQDPALVNFKKERVNFWLAKGAQPTETVKKLIIKI